VNPRRRDRHGRYVELISAALVGGLSVAEEADLEAHLTACERCSLVASEYRRESAALHTLSPVDPPRDLRARTAVALDRELTRGILPWLRHQDPDEPPRRGLSAGSGLAATIVLLVVGALVGGQVLPFALLGAGLARARATPFAVPPQELALVGADPEGLAILRASVNQVCPRPIEDCIDVRADREILRASILRSPSAVALGPSGDRIAITGRDVAGGVVFAVVELRPLGRPDGRADRGQPSGRTDSDRSTHTAKASDGSGSTRPARSPRPTDAARRTSPVIAVDPTTPVAEPSDGAQPAGGQASRPPEATITPPDGAGETEARAILRGVLAAGAPPAWSADGRTLAFSAMPADGSAGPDIYLWHPGDTEARRLTEDHRSWFASWAGSRIVISRPVARPEAEDSEPRVVPETVVIDPSTGAERVIESFRAWLPAVDPTGRWVICWRGRLEPDVAAGTRPVTGVLVLADWRQIDPFGAGGDPHEALISGHVVGRGSMRVPLRDWEVRWSDDGRGYGVWIADGEGAETGTLTVAASGDRAGTSKAEILLGPARARRGFSIGLDRVAWVAPGSAGQGGDVLQVGTWGERGAGALRVTVLETTPAVPGF
jgi:hypothetical protein